MTTIKSFTDLIVWEKGHRFVLEVYELTKSFPLTERYGLSSQLRRAAVSVTSNIAEGFERRSSKELRQFLVTARGSLAEAQNQLLLAKDLGYIGREEFVKIAKNTVELHKLLNAFLKPIRMAAH